MSTLLWSPFVMVILCSFSWRNFWAFYWSHLSLSFFFDLFDICLVIVCYLLFVCGRKDTIFICTWLPIYSYSLAGKLFVPKDICAFFHSLLYTGFHLILSFRVPLKRPQQFNVQSSLKLINIIYFRWIANILLMVDAYFSGVWYKSIFVLNYAEILMTSFCPCVSCRTVQLL